MYGDQEGYPVLYFHGLPGCRKQTPPDLKIAEKYSLCIYSLDRPGIGRSTHMPARKLSDWPKDVLQFAERLKIDKFAVLGVSAGGPYALACAYEIPERLSFIGIVSSMAPIFHRELFDLLQAKLKMLFVAARSLPEISEIVQDAALYIFKKHPLIVLKRFIATLPKEDQRILSIPAVTAMFQNDVAEAFQAGSRGVVKDMSILTQPWGFSPNAIKRIVHIWHGTVDSVTPIDFAHYYIKTIPQTRAHIIENKGHFMAVECVADIFQTITQVIHNRD